MYLQQQCVEGDELDAICKRYADVFQQYNPRFEEINGPNYVQRCLRTAAGVTIDDDNDQCERKVNDLITRDEFFLDNVSYRWTTPVGSVSKDYGQGDLDSEDGGDEDDDDDASSVNLDDNPKRPSPADQCRLVCDPVPRLSKAQRKYLDGVKELDKTAANSMACWKALEALKKFIDAVKNKWFEVDGLIHVPATRMFPEAVLSKLHDLVAEDKAELMASMLGRVDRLYGDVDVDTVIYEKKQYTCIDLAAHFGSVRCLEWLLAHQRYRIDEPGPSRMPLATIATIAKQPLSLVALDYFCDTNKLTVEEHKNFINYGILQSGPKEQTVLHLCVEKYRSDLLRYCADRVLYHLETENKEGISGQTALQLANFKLRMANFLTPEQRSELQLCVRHLEQLQSGLDGTDSTSASTTAAQVAMGPPGIQPSPPPEEEDLGLPPALPSAEEMAAKLASLAASGSSRRRRKKEKDAAAGGDDRADEAESSKRSKSHKKHKKKEK